MDKKNDVKETLLSKIANEVATMFGKKLMLERMKLEDGTTVEVDGEDISIVTEEDELIPAPVGEHTLEDGSVVVVEEEGKIASVKEAELKKDEEKMKEKEDVKFATAEEVSALKSELAEIKEMLKTNLSKEEPKTEEVKEKPKKEEFAEVEKVKHSPEKKAEKKFNFNTNTNRGQDTKANVYKKLFS